MGKIFEENSSTPISQRKLPIRRSVRMRNGAQLCPGRGDHKNRGVNRRKNDIENRIEQDFRLLTVIQQKDIL